MTSASTGGCSARLARIPNALPELPGEPAADRERVVLAAGRLVPRTASTWSSARSRQDEPLRRRLGAAAQQTARRYDLSAVGARWERLLADLGVPAPA